MMLGTMAALWPNRWRISTVWPRDSRKLMRRSLLRLLAIAHDQRLDVARLVANLADEHRGSNRRLLLRLARRLNGGLSVVTALEQTPGVLRDHQVLAIRFGTQSGTLHTTYQDLIREGKQNDCAVDRDLRNAAYYFGAMLLVLTVIITFLILYVYPTLDQIVTELGLVDPPWFYRIVAWGYQYVGILIFLVPLVILGVCALIWTGPAGGRLRRRLADSRLHWVRKQRVAELLELLAQSVVAGRPLDGALSTLARYHFDKNLRLRLLFVRNEVEQGANVWDSFLESNLLSAEESQALAASSSPDSQAWLMRRLASRKRQQAITFAEATAKMFQVLTVLSIAAVVFVLSIAAYQYLTFLVYTLT